MMILETLPAEPGTHCFPCSIPGYGPAGQPVPLAVVRRYLSGDDQPYDLCEDCKRKQDTRFRAQAGAETCILCDSPWASAQERTRHVR